MRPADGIRISFHNEFRKAGWIEYDRHQIIVNNRLWKAIAGTYERSTGTRQRRGTRGIVA